MLPELLDSREYDLFNLETADQAPLTLDEAAAKAAELRRGDKSTYYRVVPVDVNLTGFRIEKVPTEKLYTDFLSSIFRFCGRIMRPQAR